MKTANKNLAFVLASLLVLSLAAVGAAQELRVKDNVLTIDGPKWAPGEIVVRFKRGVSDDVIRAINEQHGASVLSISSRGQFRRLRIPPNKTVEQMVEIYSLNPNVEYAEQNFIATALMVPSDTYYSYQWHFHGPAHGGISMESAWDIQTGSPTVIVAVVDTGVAYENYSQGRGRFKDNYYLAPDLANTSFVAGYDFANNDEHANDDEGHGTHVTGTIAQSTNNNLGVAGIAFNTSIMPVKVLDSSGSGYYTDIADGIYFAADNGADVINMSLGGSGPSATLENAVAYAYGMGVTIVCAAGNNYGPVLSYPAAYNTYCIAVGATRYDQTLSYYSSYGAGLDLVAPGGDIYIDQNGDGYSDGVLQQTFGNSLNDWGYFFYQGTSMASPHVAGVAALLIANGNADTNADGTTSPDEVRAALQETATDLGAPGWDQIYGWGLLDAAAALAYSAGPVHDVAIIALDAPLDAYQGDLVQISVTVANQGTDAETTTVTLTDTTGGGPIGSDVLSLDAGGSTTLSFDWDTTGASITAHLLEAEASVVAGETDTADNTASATVTINDASAATMHVAGIAMSLKEAGVNSNGVATVTIVNAGGAPVAGATVSAQWSNATSDSDVGTTDALGTVTLQSDKVKKAPSGTTFTVTVTNVVKSGWTYDPAQDVQNSGSIDVQ